MNIKIEKKSPLQTIREEQKLSLKKLEAITGLSNSYLSKLERGKERLHADNLPVLSKALDVSMGYLLGENELKEEYIYLLWYENIHVFANNTQEEELKPWGFLKHFLINAFPGKDVERVILIRIKDDSMSPEIKSENVVIAYKIDSKINFELLHGTYIFKYDEEVFVRKLFFNKEKNIIKATAENSNYPNFEIDLTKESLDFKIVGEILSVLNKVSKT